MQMSGVQTNFYNADGQVLCLSAMKRETTSNLDCKATTTIGILFFLLVHPTFKWKVKQTISGSIPLVLLSLEAT